MNAHRAQAGVMLVESLVALTILTLSLGAAAALLVQALRNEREAACRTAALRLAATLAEDLRSLRRHDGLALQAVSNPGDAHHCEADPGDCLVELAAIERLAEWYAAAQAGLPEGSEARVEVHDNASPSYLITLGWPGFGEAGRSALRLAVET
jgi:type IV pilus modification protein PilV